jgi:hypothetical protein
MTDALLPPSDESNAATGDHALEHHSDALMCALPLRQVVQQGGWARARSPILLPFVLLFVGWVARAAISRTPGNV